MGESIHSLGNLTAVNSLPYSIQENLEDRVSAGNCTSPPIITDLGVKIANWQMLTGNEVRRVMEQGGVLKRDVRYSLTCRDVERVSNVKSFIR
jgi:alkylated DNA repair protein alkB homolog 6